MRQTDPEVPASLIARLAGQITGTPRVITLVDGRSGSGKTTLAVALAQAINAVLIRLDALYPGWGGLEAGSRHVTDHVLSDTAPRWRAWDWRQSAPGAWYNVDTTRHLIIEGSGALSRVNRSRADYGIWVDEPDAALRKARALQRDGEMYAPHWDDWAAQETTFLERERPWEIADAVVDSSTWTLRLSAEPPSGAERG